MFESRKRHHFPVKMPVFSTLCGSRWSLNPLLYPPFDFTTGLTLAREGELQAAFGPAEQQSEDRAIRTAQAVAGKHAGVIA